MQDWSHGYMTEVAYTFGYYPELNPLRSRIALLEAGIVPPAMQAACELGFGQGLSINIHQASSGLQWHGTDFNPAQVGFARDLAAGSPLEANLSDEAFAAFAQRDDLPMFDFIGLHGIWSWISDTNRATIVDFIERRLNVGGVVYVSYNTQPGWAANSPLTELMGGFDAAMNPAGTATAARIDAALDFVDRVLGTDSLYAKSNPQAAEHVKRMRAHDRRYLAHEYFNRDWLPMSFARMARWLEGARLQYATPAHFADHVPMLNLTPAQQELLAGINDPVFRETVTDFFVNRQFRRDYWVRGARRLAPGERADRLRAERVMLTQPAESVVLKITGSLGEATLHDAMYRPILNALADQRPHTLGELEAAVASSGIALARIIETVMILGSNNILHPVQPEDVIAQARPGAARLNKRLCEMAMYAEDVHNLASPVTGGGVKVGRIDQLFLLARRRGREGSDAWAAFANETLASQGHRVLRDGQALAPVEQAEELQVQARAFEMARLPMLIALGVAQESTKKRR